MTSHWYRKYQQETRLSSSFHHSFMKTRAWVKEKIKFEITMHYNSTNSGSDFLDQLVRAPTSVSWTKHGSLKLFFRLTDVTCINAFVLWMLKYPSWQQKRIIEHIYKCFPWEKKSFKTTYKKEGWQWKRRQTYSRGHESDGCHLKNPYNCEERRRKTAWKVFYLFNS
jgi:hypothetical protein